MKNLGPINFIITPDETGYCAQSVGHAIFTEGDTFDELIANIKEAVSLYVEEEISLSSYFTIMYSDIAESKTAISHA